MTTNTCPNPLPGCDLYEGPDEDGSKREALFAAGGCLAVCPWHLEERARARLRWGLEPEPEQSSEPNGAA